MNKILYFPEERKEKRDRAEMASLMTMRSCLGPRSRSVQMKLWRSVNVMNSTGQLQLLCYFSVTLS